MDNFKILHPITHWPEPLDEDENETIPQHSPSEAELPFHKAFATGLVQGGKSTAEPQITGGAVSDQPEY